ncbi:hypothetical protein [Pseudomonas aeruginosa]|uniref:hypothetical protein n=1 Tax=Pseudomonas aeruginosa TaxID=287 RepID=UPI001C4FA819|nr:hypothetical protein [Pseudomonas aeruginosa]
MNKANECTCPSGDGSLVHPCPAHPAVEQAGGDRWDALQSIMEWTAAENIPDDRKLCLIRNAARAALAQPSPMYDPKRCLACGGDHGNSGLPCPNMRVTAQAQPSPKCVKCGGTGEADSGGVHPWGEPVLIPCDCETEQAVAERPEVVAYADPVAFATFKERGHEGGVAGREWMWAEPGAALVAMSRTDECERIVGALREQYECNTAIMHARTEALSRVTSERDAALARVAELEGKLTDWVHEGFRLNEALAVAKAQPSVPEISGIGRDAEHPRAVVLYLRNEPSDEDMRAIQNFLRAMAAPAQHSVPKAWLDVQAERRRQVEAQALRQEVAALRARADVLPEVFGLERYRVEKTGKGFWPYCVRAGDGTRELFVGHLKQCQRVATELATAFEDGKFIAAPGSSAQHSVPEGWKLVPVEPTEDVLEAIHNGGYVGDDQELRWFYQSILAAAPAPGGE